MCQSGPVKPRACHGLAEQGARLGSGAEPGRLRAQRAVPVVHPALSHGASGLLLSREALPELPQLCPSSASCPERGHVLHAPTVSPLAQVPRHSAKAGQERPECAKVREEMTQPSHTPDWKAEIIAKLGRGRAPSSTAQRLPVAPSQLGDWGKRSSQQGLSRAGSAGPFASKGCCAAPLGWGCSDLS